MADQPGIPEIKERVADVRKPDKAVADQADQKREDPGTSSSMVGKAVEEPRKMEEITENSAVTGRTTEETGEYTTEMGGRMAHQPGIPEIKERVADVRKPEKAVADQADQKREDPGTSSMVGKAVEEPGTAGVTENPIQEIKYLEEIEGFEWRYFYEMESYAAINRSPRVASGVSGFYTLPIDEPSTERNYVPVCVNFREIRNTLMDETPDDKKKKQLRHYYHHHYAILKRFGKTGQAYLLLMMKKKEVIAKWYSDKGETTADFPQLLGLHLSGCFIIDLFHKWQWNELSSTEDPECCHQWASELWVDLLLVENQIPLFILQDINTSFSEVNFDFLSLEKLVYYYFKDFVPLREQPLPNRVHHLLEFVHLSLLPDRHSNSRHGSTRWVWICPLLVCILAPLLCIFISVVCIFNLFKTLARFCCRATPPTGCTQCVCLMNILKKIEEEILQNIFYGIVRKSKELKKVVPTATVPTATRLQQAGIKFRPVEGKGFVAEFKHGVLRLPRLHVRRNTGKLLANLIAWEKCHHGAVKYFINYAIFMDYLVNTSKDIEILIQSKVSENSLGTDEQVASVFNELGKNLVYTINEEDKEEYDFLPQLSKDLNNYCEIKFHRWRENLMSDYFKSPWSIISLIGGLFLILLTTVQTFFSAYSYFRPSK